MNLTHVLILKLHKDLHGYTGIPKVGGAVPGGGGADRQQAPGGGVETEFGHRDIKTKNCAMAVHTATKGGCAAPAGTPLVPLNEKILISPIASFASPASVVSSSDGNAPISFNVSIASFSPLLSTFGITRGFDRACRKGRHSSLAQSLHFSTTNQGGYSKFVDRTDLPKFNLITVFVVTSFRTRANSSGFSGRAHKKIHTGCSNDISVAMRSAEPKRMHRSKFNVSFGGTANFTLCRPQIDAQVEI